MQISRLFEIVYLLLGRKTMTAGELAAHFEVSPRTIYRDVDTLAQAGIPIYASKGSGGGIRLTESFVLNKSVLSGDERQSILASLHGMNALHIAEVQPVLAKLGALFNAEQEDWVEVDFSSWNPNDPISGRFELLKKAIFARRVVTFSYSGASGDTLPRAAEPMKLVFRGYDWYLLAWCRLREDFRYFKLVRMEGLLQGEEGFERRPLVLEDKRERSDLNALQTALTVCVAPEQAFRVRDEFAPEQVERQPDGGFLVRFEMPESQWLYEYLMTYGAGLRVLSPERVRVELVRRLKAALEQYDGEE